MCHNEATVGAGHTTRKPPLHSISQGQEPTDVQCLGAQSSISAVDLGQLKTGNLNKNKIQLKDALVQNTTGISSTYLPPNLPRNRTALVRRSLRFESSCGSPLPPVAAAAEEDDGPFLPFDRLRYSVPPPPPCAEASADRCLARFGNI